MDEAAIALLRSRGWTDGSNPLSSSGESRGTRASHRLPADSFIGGFPTPAPLTRVDRSRLAGIRNPNRTLPLDLGPANDR
jgi:hypothetical protein